MADAIAFRLYLITDRKLVSGIMTLEDAVRRALDGGLPALQLREKDMPARDLITLAERMRRLTLEYGAKLFINDRADVALAVEADGVHLTTTSIPPGAVRRAFGNRVMIGASTHSADEAAAASGADFVTFGPVYDTPSKRAYGPPVGIELLRQVATNRDATRPGGNNRSVPVFALGGVTLDRVQELREAGAFGVALISDILTASDITSKTASYIKALS